MQYNKIRKLELAKHWAGQIIQVLLCEKATIPDTQQSQELGSQIQNIALCKEN